MPEDFCLNALNPGLTTGEHTPDVFQRRLPLRYVAGLS